MKEIKVDLLIIGDVACSSFAACEKGSHFVSADNATDITPAYVPVAVSVGGIWYDLRDAAVINASENPVRVTSAFVRSGKCVFVSGSVSSMVR